MGILKAVGLVLNPMLGEYRILPNVEEMFSLRVIPADPMKLAELAGLNQQCVFLGPAYPRRHYKKIRMKDFGQVSSERAQEMAANIEGRLLEGQACESFLRQYPVPSEYGPKVVLFGTSEWQTLQRGTPVRRIACLTKTGNSWTTGLTWSEDTIYNGVWAVVFDD